MKLQSLIQEFSKEEILGRLQELYDECSEEGYSKAIDALSSLVPSPSEGIIYITLVKEDFDHIPLTEEECWAGVHGKFPDSEDFWAIEFVPWAEWLDMEIAPQSLEEFSHLDILCHCLWEMTWAGFEESKIQDYVQTLKDQVEDVKAHPEKLISWDDLKKEFGDDD